MTEKPHLGEMIAADHGRRGIVPFLWPPCTLETLVFGLIYLTSEQ